MNEVILADLDLFRSKHSVQPRRAMVSQQANDNVLTSCVTLLALMVTPRSVSERLSQDFWPRNIFPSSIR